MSISCPGGVRFLSWQGNVPIDDISGSADTCVPSDQSNQIVDPRSTRSFDILPSRDDKIRLYHQDNHSIATRTEASIKSDTRKNRC